MPVLFCGGYEGRIVTLEFDTAARTLQAVATSKEGGNAPTWLELSEDRKHLYATDEWGEPEGVLTSFALTLNSAEQSSPKLTKLTTVPSGGLWPCHSTLLPATSSRPARLLTSNYKGASVVSHVVLPSGELDTSKEGVQLLSFAGKGTPGPHPTRQSTQQYPRAVTLDPRGITVLVPDLGTDELRILAVDGSLTFLEESTVTLPPGSGPRHVLFDSSGAQTVLYVLNELSNSISTFTVDYPSSAPSYPSFTLLQDSISLLPPSGPTGTQSPFPHWHAAELAILSPPNSSSRYLIATNRAEDHDPLNGTSTGTPDLIASFPLSTEGQLMEASKRMINCGGRAPRHCSVSEDGKWLAVACHDSDEVIVFDVREGGEGLELGEVARVGGVGRPGCVVWY